MTRAHSWFRSLRPYLWCCLLVTLFWLGGCAAPRALPAAGADAQAHWQGRLAVKVYSKPVQAFSANFELQGQAARGELTLTSPLGTTLARMQWDQASATLQANGAHKRYGSLQELAREATGTELPVTSLFAWLQGRDEVAAGWQVDLTNLPQGRLQAQHTEDVQAELKIILDQ